MSLIWKNEIENISYVCRFVSLDGKKLDKLELEADTNTDYVDSGTLKAVNLATKFMKGIKVNYRLKDRDIHMQVSLEVDKLSQKMLNYAFSIKLIDKQEEFIKTIVEKDMAKIKAFLVDNGYDVSMC